MKTYRILATFFLITSILFFTEAVNGQQQCTVRDGKMFVNLGKSLSDREIDEFVRRFSLENLALKKFIRTGYKDSVELSGWQIVVNNAKEIVLIKSFEALGNININWFLNNPNDSLQRAGFPELNAPSKFGLNTFRNKQAFPVRDSIVTFYLRENLKADRVMLAGSFNNWNPGALAMTKTDSGWIANLKLAPGKYFYKFIIDGNWQIDHDNRQAENDGRGNTNSVFFVPNTRFSLQGYPGAKKVILTGSFNEWNEKELSMMTTGDGWSLDLYLVPGTHTYRFIVDRKWITDPVNPNRFPNEFGEYNSYVAIGEPYHFKLEGYPGAGRVTVTGTFNNWKQHELIMNKTPGGWELPYVLGPGNHTYRFFVDGKPVGNDQFLVLEPNYTFRLKGVGQEKSVFLAGDFNHWAPNSIPMKYENGEWVISLHLTKGKHLYKFIVNGQWILDPGNPLWEQNEHQTGNSVIWMEAP